MGIGLLVQPMPNECVRPWSLGRDAFLRVYKDTNKISLTPAIKPCRKGGFTLETEELRPAGYSDLNADFHDTESSWTSLLCGQSLAATAECCGELVGAAVALGRVFL